MKIELSLPQQDRRNPATLEDPLYYLRNFAWVIEWVRSRYDHLLNADEHRFVAEFLALPEASQGLLVRMVMRKGSVFRGDKLVYPELGATPQAIRPLVDRQWVKAEPLLDPEALFNLFTWPELRRVLAEPLTEAGFTGNRKGEALAALSELGLDARTAPKWGLPETPVFEFCLMPLCDRFRLMFFGNMHQDWSEFVVTELGTYHYEQVEFTEDSRPFHSRAEIDTYLQLHACRENFYKGEALDEIAAAIPPLPSENPWLVRMRDRLVFKMAREWERAGELGEACLLYHDCGHPEARGRLLRVLEKGGDHELALALAQQVHAAPTTEAERQHLHRILPRLERKLGLMPSISRPTKVALQTLELSLPAAASVELAVVDHLHTTDAPAHYVENTLLTGLFGLLCWEAVFAPLPGAFFHPFQRGPADLHWPDFYQRRKASFDACLGKLESGDHGSSILKTFTDKQGRQSPFVHWDLLSETLLQQALLCIPPQHLKLIFERILTDIQSNRAGLPDLIQFWPEQCRYQMIEVKGPGDRLQDNQRRWLEFFARHGMPASVCHVIWESPVESS